MWKRRKREKAESVPELTFPCNQTDDFLVIIDLMEATDGSRSRDPQLNTVLSSRGRSDNMSKGSRA